jgi:hypothetical protein
MGTERFDAIVLGTGQSGPSLAADLANAGQRVAIVERGKFGGTCVNTGCIPTKTLVASARAAWVARNAAEFGVDVGAVTVDMARVNARMKQVSGASNSGVEKWLEGLEGVTVVRGHARFTGPKQVRVGERVLAAEKFFLDVGGRAFFGGIFGLFGWVIGAFFKFWLFVLFMGLIFKVLFGGRRRWRHHGGHWKGGHGGWHNWKHHHNHHRHHGPGKGRSGKGWHDNGRDFKGNRPPGYDDSDGEPVRTA